MCVCVFACVYGVIVCDPGRFFFFLWLDSLAFPWFLWPPRQLQGLVCVSVCRCVCVCCTGEEKGSDGG